MLKARSLNRMVPRGFRVEAMDIPAPQAIAEIGGLRVAESDRVHYQCRIYGFQRSGVHVQHSLKLSFPIPVNGVVEVNGLRKMVVQEAIVDLAEYQLGQPPRYYIHTRTQVVASAVESILARHLMETFMTGQLPSETAIQADIDTWFKTDPMSQDVPDSEAGTESLKAMVYVRAPDGGLDITPRLFSPNLVGIFDPASTPANEKVNLAYRLCEGVEVTNGIPRPGTSLFCRTINRYHGPVALSPRRTHISRSPYEHALELDAVDKVYWGGQLSGRHLRTAIMRFGAYTGEDAIVMSQTAAEKLRAKRKVVESFAATGAIHLKVKVGDTIMPGDIIAEATSPDTDADPEVRTRKLKHPATVMDISAVHSTWFNIPCVRVRVTLESSLVLQSGDKVFTRGAIKGVVRVLPDDQMPRASDGEIIEAIISPESVVGRRSMSVYWEAMANEAAKDGVPILMDHFAPRPSFPELVEKGYGEMDTLSLRGQPLSEPVFYGDIFFIRLDKIASEIISYHKGGVQLNGMGLPSDTAKAAGQKRDLAKGIGMLARGMNHLFSEYSTKNMYASRAYAELVKVLTGPSTPTPASVQATFEGAMS